MAAAGRYRLRCLSVRWIRKRSDATATTTAVTANSWRVACARIQRLMTIPKTGKTHAPGK